MTTALKYTVLPGDSFYQIAAGLNACAGITAQAIQQANPGIDPARLTPGQVINIPAAGSSDTPIVIPDAQYIGYWNRTWSPGPAPAGTNIGIAFSGWTDPVTALAESAKIKNSLTGSTYLSLGGGNDNGAFDSTRLAAITAAINAGNFEGYDGIAYDVEEGAAGLASLFGQSFAAAKARRFKVLVTVSHSAPYGMSDAALLMQSFFADPNIDFLSPQLYTSGNEQSNDYETTAGVQWAAYAQAKARVIPSVVNVGMYADAKAYFQKQGVTIQGCVQWNSGS